VLVLTRKPGESILIGEDIRVTVIEIRAGKQVRLGIEVPPKTLILREDGKKLSERDES